MKKILNLYKRFIIVFIFTILFSSVVYGEIKYVCLNLKYDGKNHQYVEQEVNLKINNKEMNNLSMPPVIFNNYTLVPAREVFEEVGAKVSWDKNTYTVTVSGEEKKVVIKIGDKKASVNGAVTEMSVPAKIINDKTMIPLRFVSSSVGLGVVWEQNSRTALITGNIKPDTVAVTGVSLSSAKNGRFVINADKVLSSIEPIFLKENGSYKLAIDINNAKIKMSESVDVSESIVSKIRTGQNDNVARVVFDLKSECEYAAGLSSDKKSIIVTFSGGIETNEPTTEEATTEKITEESTTEASQNSSSNTINSDTQNSVLSVNGITYDDYKTCLTIKKNGGNFNINAARHTDDYNNGVYTISFDGNYGSFIKNGVLKINDHNLNSIEVNVGAGAMSVVFSENQVLAYDVREDTENIYINLIKPKDKYKNVVVLDAGHGGHDSGATAQGYVEKTITLDTLNRAMALFEKNDNIKAYATRTTDVYPSFDERTGLGNSVGDLFVSIHINSASNTNANGTEVYYHDTTDVTLPRGISSSELAYTLKEKLLLKLKSFDRNVKREDFIVLRQSSVPSSLCEIGFITNPTEGAKLNSPEYRQLAAEAIYEAIKELFEKHPSR